MATDAFAGVYADFEVKDHAEQRSLTTLASHLESELAAGGSTPFSAAATFGFTNSVAEVRNWLSRCAAMLADQFGEFRSLYTELNAFDINHDRWFASLMAAETFIPPDASLDDWAEAEWFLHHRESLTLTGSEAMQDAFCWRYTEKRDQRLEEQQDREQALAAWLVWARWLELLQRAWEAGPIPEINVPLTATAHGFDTLVRLEPTIG